MMSLEDYQGMEETAYLLQAQANARRLSVPLRPLKQQSKGSKKEAL
jgi:PHD/YefM family antitoxin component YafN of YafNO toxin-antitoxin module